MKKFLILLICILILTSCGIENDFSKTESETVDAFEYVSDVNSEENGLLTEKYNVLNHEYMKAVWLSQFDMKEIYQNDGRIY